MNMLKLSSRLLSACKSSSVDKGGLSIRHCAKLIVIFSLTVVWDVHAQNTIIIQEPILRLKENLSFDFGSTQLQRAQKGRIEVSGSNLSGTLFFEQCGGDADQPPYAFHTLGSLYLERIMTGALISAALADKPITISWRLTGDNECELQQFFAN